MTGKASESKWQEALTPLEAGHKINKATPLFKKIDADEKQLDEMLAQTRAKMTKTA
jgi:methionyl-tRNA synthetase